MKLYLLSCCLVVLVAAVSALPSAQEWNQYKLEHGKVYSSRGEEAMRRANFERSKAMIAKLNSQHLGKTQFKLNHLSDISDEEYAKMNGLRFPEGWETEMAKIPKMSLEQVMEGMDDELPKNFDWRDMPGRVSEVKDQGKCGSCWAFSATGAIEGQEMVKKLAKNIPLSEQQLIDCSVWGMGCAGGNPAFSLIEVEYWHGIMSEVDYPYMAKDSATCKFNITKSVFATVGERQFPNGDDRAMQAGLVKYGPVSVGIDATKVLQHYSGGVLDDTTCSSNRTSINHAVLLIGYGTDEKQGDYWLVKNSWGAKWGEMGYFRLSRKTPSKCGISQMTIMPTV